MQSINWGIIGVVLIIAAVIIGLMFLPGKVPQGLVADDVERPDEDDNIIKLSDDGVDPWYFQRELMAASDQELPDRPRLTLTSLLYLALIAEEYGELMLAVAKAVPDDVNEALFLSEKASVLALWAAKMRETIAECPRGWNVPLEREDAIEILDGTTDVAVVNSGFALSTGLPGSAAYLEVVTSNLSKRNPDTGKIDKTPDGKWIKGRDFRKPDLEAVLTGNGHHG